MHLVKSSVHFVPLSTCFIQQDAGFILLTTYFTTLSLQLIPPSAYFTKNMPIKTAQSGQVAKLSGQVAKLSGQVAKLSGQVAKLSGRVVKLKGHLIFFPMHFVTLTERFASLQMPVVKFSLLFVFFSQAQNILSKCYTPREMDFKKRVIQQR